MKFFISYVHEDREAVRKLAADLGQLGHSVWIDDDLVGGQEWWTEILRQIRGAEAFVAGLSPDYLRSQACVAEFDYARALNKQVLPVLVTSMATARLRGPMARLQWIDYSDRTADAAIRVVTWIKGFRRTVLPDPLPDEPELPQTYSARLAERVHRPSLSVDEQNLLVNELEDAHRDGLEVDDIEGLLGELQARHDLVTRVDRRVGTLLSSIRSLSLPVAAEPGAGAGPPEISERAGTFDVVMLSAQSVDESTIALVRRLNRDLGYFAARSRLRSLPAPLALAVDWSVGEDLRRRLEAMGIQASVQPASP